MPANSLSIAEALDTAIKQLHSSDTAKLDSEILLLQVLNKTAIPPLTKTWLLTWPEKLLTAEQIEQYNHYLDLRESGMPIAYITSTKDFWTFSLEVNSHTLIPRPETELLVESTLEKISSTEETHILDLGTGSGAIALAIASERPQSQVLATDISHDALAIAEKNARSLKLTNINFLQSHWFDAIITNSDIEKFDIIVSNPPYIAEDDPLLEENVRKFEPTQALISNDKGLNDIKQIIKNSVHYLKPGGWLFFEHGHTQANEVQTLLKTHSFNKITTINDLNHHPRVTFAQL